MNVDHDAMGVENVGLLEDLEVAARLGLVALNLHDAVEQVHDFEAHFGRRRLRPRRFLGRLFPQSNLKCVTIEMLYYFLTTI